MQLNITACLSAQWPACPALREAALFPILIDHSTALRPEFRAMPLRTCGTFANMPAWCSADGSCYLLADNGGLNTTWTLWRCPDIRTPGGKVDPAAFLELKDDIDIREPIVLARASVDAGEGPPLGDTAKDWEQYPDFRQDDTSIMCQDEPPGTKVVIAPLSAQMGPTAKASVERIEVRDTREQIASVGLSPKPQRCRTLPGREHVYVDVFAGQLLKRDDRCLGMAIRAPR